MLPEPSQSGSCYWSTPGLPKGHPYNFCWTRGFLDGRGPSLFRLLEPLEGDNRPCPPRMPHFVVHQANLASRYRVLGLPSDTANQAYSQEECLMLEEQPVWTTVAKLCR
ncbi:uncharacterized protein LOC144103913 isoform X4 [Amblyomma americanum]